MLSGSICRRGFALTEILTVLFFIGALALVASRLFTSEMRVIRQAEAQQDRSSQLRLVVGALREDVWSASAVEVAEDGRLLTLREGQNRTIVWRTSDDSIRRVTSENDTPRTFAAPFPIRAERDPAGVTLRLDEHTAGGPGESRLRLPSQVMLAAAGGAS